MKKIILFLTAILLSVSIVNAQTTATNFTATDCASSSHTLFTELDNGKIVVLVWVMPCGACISDAKAAYDAVQGFATSNPGKVLYWLSDDAGNNSCSSISSWASTNSISSTGSTFFDNSGTAINEANFGGSGMPHVVVMGGTNHKIYYNKLNGANDGAAITNAITTALSPTAIQQITNETINLNVYPNPSKGKVSVSYALSQIADVSFDVINVVGTRVSTTTLTKQSTGNHEIVINTDGSLKNGIYFLKMNTGNSSQIVKFIIAN